jgi:hypothetical protein
MNVFAGRKINGRDERISWGESGEIFSSRNKTLIALPGLKSREKTKFGIFIQKNHI